MKQNGCVLSINREPQEIQRDCIRIIKNVHMHRDAYIIIDGSSIVVVLHVPGWPGCSPCGGEPMHLRLVFLGVLLFLFPYFQLF